MCLHHKDKEKPNQPGKGSDVSLKEYCLGTGVFDEIGIVMPACFWPVQGTTLRPDLMPYVVVRQPGTWRAALGGIKLSLSALSDPL